MTQRQAPGPEGARPFRRRPVGDRLERSISDRAASEEVLEDLASGGSPPRSLRKTAIWVAITGISLYLVAPSLIDVFGSWNQLSEIAAGWFVLLAALQGLSLASVWALQKTAIPGAPNSAVIESQLAGNALSKIAPGGGAMGAALQYKMLRERGLPGPAVAAALTAVNLLTFAVVLALPVLAVPAMLGGSVDGDLLNAALLSIGVFAVLVAIGAILFLSDRALEATGRIVQIARNRIRRRSPAMTSLPKRLLRERARLASTLGQSWKRAILATVGRWAFDYAILFAALAAVGSHPRPGLTLLAFCSAQVLSQIPVTPGGLGFVEAGLTATLALAGVGAADALLATFTYRLFTYWLPLPLGLAGAALHRRHPRPGP